MQMFKNQDEMKKAYIEYRVGLGADAATAGLMFHSNIHYTPHIYRGGVVIRGFGFTTERIDSVRGMAGYGDPYGV